MVLDEERVISRIQQWFEDDFVKLYDFYIQKIYNYIYYKVWNKNDAEDITSETFMKAFDNIKSFDLSKNTKFSSWLYMIASNNVVDHYRKNDKEKSYDWLEDRWEDTNIVWNLDNRHKLNEVLKFLDSLWEDKKEIFVMRIWDQLSYDEISAITGKTVSNCKVIFSRSLAKVIEKFGVIWVIVLILSR